MQQEFLIVSDQEALKELKVFLKGDVYLPDSEVAKGRSKRADVPLMLEVKKDWRGKKKKKEDDGVEESVTSVMEPDLKKDVEKGQGDEFAPSSSPHLAKLKQKVEGKKKEPSKKFDLSDLEKFHETPSRGRTIKDKPKEKGPKLYVKDSTKKEPASKKPSFGDGPPPPSDKDRVYIDEEPEKKQTFWGGFKQGFNIGKRGAKRGGGPKRTLAGSAIQHVIGLIAGGSSRTGRVSTGSKKYKTGRLSIRRVSRR